MREREIDEGKEEKLFEEIIAVYVSNLMKNNVHI